VRRSGPAPQREIPHGDPLGTAGADRLTESVHVGLDEQEQIRRGERPQRCCLVGRKELEQPVWIDAAIGHDLGASHPSAADGHIQVQPDQRPPHPEDPLASWITAPGPAAEAESRAAWSD
jgi:hypothetical protein